MANDTAFALAGLGGFNAHGAGFLQAARDNDYRPDLVTATSGQVLILANYLNGKPDLSEGLIDKQLADNPWAQMQALLAGSPGVVRPAYLEAFKRLFQPPRWTDSFVDMVADRMLPAQAYVLCLPDATFEAAAATFNKSPIGVVFNAYDPVAGQGVLFGNGVAREQLGAMEPKLPFTQGNRPKDPRYGRDGPGARTLLEIDAQAVKSALWLSLYGFEGLPGGRMDGAYFRSCIVSELSSFRRVIVARPLASGWLTDTPRSWYDVQDWQCEMWFSVGYKAEVDAMLRINQLIEQKAITDPKFKKVEFHEVAPHTPAGYFNYFFEREAVFKAAYVEADQLFKQLINQGLSSTAKPLAPPPGAKPPSPRQPAPAEHPGHAAH